jgi:hypothetical protein
MKALCRVVLVVAGLVAISNSAWADSVLVGTDPSTAFGSFGLCPTFSGCQADVQAFTLSSQVKITDVQVVMSHLSYPNLGSDGHFSIALVNTPIAAGNITFPSQILVGNGNLPYDPNVKDSSQAVLVSELFDFSGLDFTLGPGTYYLEFAGGDVGPARATTTLASSVGTFGKTLYCDPTINAQQCNDLSRWDAFSSFYDPDPFAVTINGDVVVPEPSGWLLLGTGIFGAAGMSRLRFNRRRVTPCQT